MMNRWHGYYATGCLMALVTWQCTTTQSNHSLSNVAKIEAPHSAPGLREICSSDVLLLTRYDAHDLYGTPLPSTCCTPGVLPEPQQWRCDHDWPSSDVPSCRFWSETSTGLKGLLESNPSFLDDVATNRARTNQRVLVEWASTQHGCIPDDSSHSGECDLAWLEERLGQILQSSTADSCEASYAEVVARMTQCIKPVITLLARSDPSGARKRTLIGQLLADGLKKHAQEVSSWQTVLLGVRSQRIQRCMADEQDHPRCVANVDGGRPSPLAATACNLFSARGAVEPARALVDAGLAGHALRPCMPYLVHFGLNDPKVRQALLSELAGKPGSKIPSTLLGLGTDLLAHLPALAATEDAMVQNANETEPLQTQPCMSLSLLKQLESQGLIAIDIIADKRGLPKATHCLHTLNAYLKQVRILEDRGLDAPVKILKRQKKDVFCRKGSNVDE